MFTGKLTLNKMVKIIHFFKNLLWKTLGFLIYLTLDHAQLHQHQAYRLQIYKEMELLNC